MPRRAPEDRTRYDATHANTLNASMASLRRHYARVGEADVIVWHEAPRRVEHELIPRRASRSSWSTLRRIGRDTTQTSNDIQLTQGDLGPADADALDGATNVRFCLLTNATGWEVPKFIDVDALPPMPWSLGYRMMIRFYAVTGWRTLRRLGYEWVMRMDDDSFLLSDVPDNLFGRLRATNRKYAYRGLSAERAPGRKPSSTRVGEAPSASVTLVEESCTGARGTSPTSSRATPRSSRRATAATGTRGCGPPRRPRSTASSSPSVRM